MARDFPGASARCALVLPEVSQLQVGRSCRHSSHRRLPRDTTRPLSLELQARAGTRSCTCTCTCTCIRSRARARARGNSIDTSSSRSSSSTTSRRRRVRVCVRLRPRLRPGTIRSHPEPVLADASAAATPSTSLPDLDAAALLDLPEQIGFLKTLGLDFGWGPSSVMQWSFEHLHVYSGMPWWASIAVTAVLLRLVMFKPLLKSQDTAARMQKLQQDPRYEEIRTGLQESMARGDSAAMTELRRDLSMMNKRAGVNPLNGLWGLLQIPFGYGMFRVLNGASSIPSPAWRQAAFSGFPT
ncbi:yidC/oxa1 family membrane protein insertase [Colletotrichum higginsianum]|nr:yidC/oxa1 family membrane protein insertase [Colletotrichum higginsianum]